MRLGSSYFFGFDVPKDTGEAIKWYRLAAENGKREAQRALADIFAFGDGVVKDEMEAAKWYRLAAEQGDADAQYILGHINAKGHGLPPDNREAVKWYRLAAEQGNTDAYCQLGNAYREGKGVSRNPAEAVKWYRRAAEEGDGDAQERIIQMYDLGGSRKLNEILALVRVIVDVLLLACGVAIFIGSDFELQRRFSGVTIYILQGVVLLGLVAIYKSIRADIHRRARDCSLQAGDYAQEI